MITSNHEKQKYKNNGLVNGARGYIDSIQVNKENQEIAEVIWVKFADDKIGQLLRQEGELGAHILLSVTTVLVKNVMHG